MYSINGKYAEDMKAVYEQWLSLGDRDHKTHNIVSIRKSPERDLTDLFTTFNIVTNSGDLFYAQSMVGAALTEDYESAASRCFLQNPASADTPAKTDTYTQFTTPIAASIKARTATYPKVADADAENTGSGADIITWLYDWLTTDFNTAAANDITGGCIVNSATPTTNDLLTHWNYLSAFEKLSTDTLKTFVNHEIRGV